MAVKIRLMRIGAKKRPFYRVVAVDERSKRTGKYLELLGTYNPLTEPKEIILKKDRIEYWVGKGAVLSDGYLRITKQAPQKPPRKPKKEKEVKPEKPQPEADQPVAKKAEEAAAEEAQAEPTEAPEVSETSEIPENPETEEETKPKEEPKSE